MSVVGTILNVIVKGFVVAENVIQGVKLAAKDEKLSGEETFAMISSFGCALLQGTQLGGSIAQTAGVVKFSAAMQIGASATVGAAHVTQAVAVGMAQGEWNADKTLNVIGVAAFRAADVAHAALQVKGHTLTEKQRNVAESAVQIVEVGGVAVVSRHAIVNVVGHVIDFTRLIWDEIHEKFVVDNAAAGAAAAAGPGAANDAASFAAANAQAAKDIQEILNWRQLDYVPACIGRHFPQCALSGKPIRFLMEPAFLTEDPTLVFDKAAVTDALANGTNRAIPGWPSDKMPLKAEYFQKGSPFIQCRVINLKLAEAEKLYLPTGGNHVA